MRVQCAHAYRVVWTGGFFPVGNEGLLSRPVTHDRGVEMTDSGKMV